MTTIVIRTNQPPCADVLRARAAVGRLRRPAGSTRDRRGAHRIASCSRNRRMFQTITGMIGDEQDDGDRRAPSVVVEEEEPADHALGDHLGAVRLRVRRMTKTMSKTFSELMTMYVVTTTIVGQDGRHDDPAEHLHLGGAVDPGRLDDLVGDRLDRGRQHHHGEPGLHPDHDHHEEQVVPRLQLEPRHGVADPDPSMTPFSSPMLRAESLRAVAVDQPPRDRGPRERDRHRQEDQRLRDGLAAAEPVDQRGEREPDAHRDERHEDEPSGGVADRSQHVVVGEHEPVVVQPDERPASSRP